MSSLSQCDLTQRKRKQNNTKFNKISNNGIQLKQKQFLFHKYVPNNSLDSGNIAAKQRDNVPSMQKKNMLMN